MKRLLLRSLSLMSHREKAATAIKFHPKVTVIKGENDTGKSSLIKSIYWALGAEPAVVHARWKDAGVSALLEFSVDGHDFSILRSGTRFGLFDSNGKPMLVTDSVTSGLAPAMANLLEFRLTLPDQNGVPCTPPPAFCFLPFYIDQDGGWVEGWKSFGKLGQFPNHRQDVIYYHSGIRPNEYYELKAQMAEDQKVLQELAAEQRAVERAMQRVKDRRKALPTSFDPAAYRDAVDGLLTELTDVQKRRAEVNARLSKKTAERTLIDEQVTVAKAALEEFDADYNFIRDDFSEHVLCPTCGTEHSNSFANRFSLIEDKEACRVFLLSATTDLTRLQQEITEETRRLGQEDFKVARLRRMLDQKAGKLKLKDVLEAEGERKAVDLLADEVDRLRSRIANLDHILAELRRDLKKLASPKRKKEIETFYLTRMTANLEHLAVRNLKPSAVERIDGVIKDTGSDQPRALLAYFYAFLHTKREYGSGCICPIVIDSPNQQDQDQANLTEMFRLIFEQQPSDAQLVLGTVDLPGIDFEGDTVELAVKDRLLNPDRYDEVTSLMKPYFDRLI